MQMQRYFIQFTYWGTRFRGLQKQRLRPLDLHKLPEDEISEVKYWQPRKKHVKILAQNIKVYRRDEATVQGALESALWHTLKPVNNVKLATSCRYGAILLSMILRNFGAD